MARQNMKVLIHTYPFFDNVELHFPGAEVTLKDEAAFTDTCMRWVEKPVIESAPGIAVPRAQTSISEGALPPPAQPSHSGGGSSAKAAAPVKRRYAKRKVGKRPIIPKATVLAPVLVPAQAAGEATTPIAEPKAADAPASIAIPEEGATPPSETRTRSESSPSTEPPLLQETAPPASQADARAGKELHSAEQPMPAPANVT